MATLTSSLIVRLIDQVSAPARKISGALLGLNNSADGGFGGRLGAAIERNNRALDAARGKLFDAAAGVFALKKVFDATAGAAMSLEDKMADIAKVSGMNVTELKEFETILRNLARGEIPLAVEELADLAAAASQSGIANEDLEAFTEMVAKTAVAWDMSGGAAGEALAKLKTALGMSIEETRAYGDAINYLSDTTASSAPDLIEFARRVAADGKVAGFSNSEVLALGATMISMGAQAEVAATSLRNVGRMLSRGEFGAKKAQLDAFKELGLDVENVAEAMQVDASGTLLEVLEAISKADAHKRLALMSGVFGDEARALMPLLAQLDQTRAAIAGVADETNYLGSVQAEFETRSKTGAYAIQRFVSQLRDIAIVVGQSVLPAMKKLLDAMAPYLLAVSDLVAQHPNLTAGLFAAAAGLIAFKVAAAGLTFVGLLGRGGALSMLSLGFNTVGRAIIGATAAAKGAVGLQAALATMSGAKFGGLAKISVAVRGIAMAVPGVSAIGTALAAIGGALAAVSLPVLGAIAAGIAAVAGAGILIWKYWDRVSSVLGGFAARIGEEFAPALEVARPLFDWLGGIGQVIGEGFGLALTKLQEFGEWIGSFFQQEVLSDDEKAAWADAGRSAADGLVNSVKAVIQGMIDWFADLPTRIIEAIGSIDIGSLIKWPSMPSWLGGGEVTAPTPGNGGHTLYPVGQAPNRRAYGGPVSGGRPVIVGDGGEPEVFTPPGNGRITPMSKLGGGGGGRSIHIEKLEINGADDPQAVAKAVTDELTRLARGAHSDSEAWS